MKPVEIKLYGLFSVTKRRYVYSMLFCLAVVVLCIAWARLILKLPLPWEDAEVPPKLAGYWVARNFHWLVFGGILLALVDSIFVFRRFARAEAKQQSTPSPPAS
jgi:hypothetical protein